MEEAAMGGKPCGRDATFQDAVFRPDAKASRVSWRGPLLQRRRLLNMDFFEVETVGRSGSSEIARGAPLRGAMLFALPEAKFPTKAGRSST